ncbi:amidohydrolase family protein [Gluconacetobacter sacchari]|uniref:Amidohydrolase family protein n=2 Tax=Gluconacetobacter sacchari TaxID=92759 RepID=A0A7W4IF58_9PROT|nr:amidohydrolase family protein [Gluconacetobacter sacchari]MBB2161761.1 amidohydrolase family protein [Gluconacetobacter sacchari]
MPILVNAHDHGRGSRPLDFGAADSRLETWLWDLWKTPRTDVYLTHLLAFANMAASGVGAVVHNHLPQGPDMIAEARQVARAARDIGIDLAFVCPVIDRNLIGYDGGRAVLDALDESSAQRLRALTRLPPVEEQIAMVEAIAEQIEGEGTTVQYGPPGPQWLSPHGAALVGRAAERTGRRVHVHVLETWAQRRWMENHHPEGIHAYFEDAGLLGPRLAIAHGVWLNACERAALAAAGVALALNASSNLRLGSGIAEFGTLARDGLKMGLGMDGMALDDDSDMLREVRLAARLFAAAGQLDVKACEEAALQSAFSEGARLICGAPAPGLEPGAPASFVELSMEALSPLPPGSMMHVARLAVGRWRREAVTSVTVRGREIVRDGKVAGIDMERACRELAQQMQKGAMRDMDWIAIAQHAAAAGLEPSGAA